MTETGKIKVRCKHIDTKCSGKPSFKCFSKENYVSCGRNDIRFVDWTFYIINAKHLIEVKSE